MPSISSHREIDGARDPWCKALHRCTACLREQTPEDSDLCLAYLGLLERALEQPSSNSNGNDNDDDDDDDDLDDYNDDDEDASGNTVPTRFPPDWRRFCARMANRAHHPPESNEDDEDDEDHDDGIVRAALAETARTIRTPPKEFRLPRQRLLTRILTSRCEVFAMKAARHVRNPPRDWESAAECYRSSVAAIRGALDVTDTAVSRWWSKLEHGIPKHPRERERLAEDAGIVLVALESVRDRRAALLSDGKREEAKLVRKLRPQWDSRDEARNRMGERRWRNNPRPKHDHSLLRREGEERLRAIRKAIEHLDLLDPAEALARASGLREELRTNHRNHPADADAAGAAVAAASARANGDRGHRYNNLRPPPEWMRHRVSLADYPDPTRWGWTFTGSKDASEFFEKRFADGSNELVKLDWYFTTATLKTSLDHPTKGNTQLFAKKCDPTLYARVLANPRVHTGKRYHRNPKRTPTNNNRGHRNESQSQ